MRVNQSQYRWKQIWDGVGAGLEGNAASIREGEDTVE